MTPEQLKRARLLREILVEVLPDTGIYEEALATLDWLISQGEKPLVTKTRQKQLETWREFVHKQDGLS